MFFKYLLRLTLISVFAFGAAWLCLDMLAAKATVGVKELTVLTLFFVVTTLAQHILLIRSKKNPQQFVRTFMLATAFKLLFLLLVLVAYVLINRESAMHFTLLFAFLYFVFTAFEAVQLSADTKSE